MITSKFWHSGLLMDAHKATEAVHNATTDEYERTFLLRAMQAIELADEELRINRSKEHG